MLMKTLVLILSVLVVSYGQKKGLTYTINVSPAQKNQYLARVGCSQCNEKDGDTDCRIIRPILCIDKKRIPRPFYDFQVNKENVNGWSGGIYAISQGVQGSKIRSKYRGDSFCRRSFGRYFTMATNQDSFYFDQMNNSPSLIWSRWNWQSKQLKRGSQNSWGILLTKFVQNQRLWVWSNSKTGNCANLPPINRSKQENSEPLKNLFLQDQFYNDGLKDVQENLDTDANLYSDGYNDGSIRRQTPRRKPKRGAGLNSNLFQYP